jgi:WD40 repeat protein
MILIVGGTDLSASLGTAELYDPATDTFTYTGSLVNARQKHTATLLSDGKVLIVGGIAGAGGSTTLTTAEIYDPATGSFGLTFASPVAARSEHSATLLQNGKVLIVSGRDQGNYVSTAEIYDPSTGQFTLTPSAPLAARATHTATLLSSGKVLIAGGFHAGALTSAELYDPAAGTFTATGTLTTPRAAQTATLLQSGKVLIVGGASVLTAELFDPNAGTNGDFTDATGSLNTARVYGHTATLLPSGSVLITGGIGAGSPAPVLANAELFDPVAQTFTQTAGLMTTAREHHTGNLLSTGKVFICGGDAGTVLASAEVYY